MQEFAKPPWGREHARPAYAKAQMPPRTWGTPYGSGYKLREARPKACGMLHQAEESHMEAVHSRQMSPTTWPACFSVPKGLSQLCREGTLAESQVPPLPRSEEERPRSPARQKSGSTTQGHHVS